MEIELLQTEAIGEAIGEGSMGWPFGLATCSSAIHTPSPALAFHQQFMNLQTTFLLPFFSDDGDDRSSSSGDSDARSEAASSFFKDSRRITLGSLIALPMDASFHAITGAIHNPDALGYHVGRTRALTLPSCGILELLRRVRHTGSSLHEFDVELHPNGAVIANSGTSLAAYLQLEAGVANHSSADSICIPDAVSNGSRSPDWNDQFVSCHSVLSIGEWTGADPHRERLPTPKPSTPKPQKSQKMQRSTSMKSFFSSICCRIDAVKRP